MGGVGERTSPMTGYSLRSPAHITVNLIPA